MLALALWVVGVTLALWALPLLADSGRVAMDWRLPRQETP
ncbi:hypothetical protein M446_4149 [Methylobacterium sp. 4-46]|nr:hypothetical protein M446_4149 [Methylobacterium sp. 4-46]